MRLRPLLLMLFFFSGFAALVYEVMFTHGLILIVGGSVFAYTIILTTFLTGMGFGSLLAKRFVSTDLATLFAYVELGIGTFGLLFVPIVNNLDLAYLQIHLGSKGNFLTFYLLLLLLLYTVLLAPTVLMGMTFPIVARMLTRLENVGTDVGAVFSFNTLGGMVGAFVGGFLLLPGIGLEKSIVVAASVNLLISVVIFVRAAKGAAIPYYVALGVVLVLGARLFDTQIDPYRLGVYHRHGEFESVDDYRLAVAKDRENAAITFSDYGLYGSVIVKEGTHKVLMINGKVDAGTGLDVPTELLLGYIPALMHPDPKDVAIIGLGSGITLAAVERFPVEHIDMLELNPTVVEAAELFREENRASLDDERVELTVGDARDFLATTDRVYDIVISEPSNPWIEGEVFLFTREFYAVVAEHLEPGGLFLQWIGAYDFNPEDLKVSLATVKTAFRHVQVWAEARGVDFFILASKEPIVGSYTKIATALQDPVIASDMSNIALISNRKPLSGADLFFSFFVAADEAVDSYVVGSPINTDNRPIIEFRTAKNRVRRTKSNLGALLAHLSAGGVTTEISPPVTDQISGDELSFLGLHAKIDMPPAEIKYEYQFTTRGEDPYNLFLSLDLAKYVIFRDEAGLLVVRAHPRETEPPAEEFAGIADSLDSNLVGTIEVDGRTRYLSQGETITALLWHCNQHIYVTYFEYPRGGALPSMVDTLGGIRCVD